MKPNLSKKFLKEFPLPNGWRIRQTKNREPYLLTGKNQAFSLDFLSKQKLSRKQPLIKAVGFKGKPIRILDITAGWAQDAFLLFKTGCHVTAVEANPFVFHFVQESLLQQGISSKNLKFSLDNSLNYLKTIKETNKPDVIYMDPMFGGKKKSLSQKPLVILKQIVGETKDKEQLFEQALKKAKHRVLVKRHRLDPPLKEKPLCIFKGRSVCYDIFMPVRGK